MQLRQVGSVCETDEFFQLSSLSLRKTNNIKGAAATYLLRMLLQVGLTSGKAHCGGPGTTPAEVLTYLYKELKPLEWNILLSVKTHRICSKTGPTRRITFWPFQYNSLSQTNRSFMMKGICLVGAWLLWWEKSTNMESERWFIQEVNTKQYPKRVLAGDFFFFRDLENRN